MKKYGILSLIIAAVLAIASPVSASTIVLPVTLTNGTAADANQVMSDFNAITAVVNGNLNSTNLSPSLGINPSSLKCTSSGTCSITTAFPLSVNSINVALVGTNKTAFVAERAVPGTLIITTSAPMALPIGAANFTALGEQYQCLTVGSGTTTFQWQYNTAADPTSGSWTAFGSSQSFTTAGGASSSFAGVNLTTNAAIWVRANISAVGGTAPQNCFFYLYGTQTVQ